MTKEELLKLKEKRATVIKQMRDLHDSTSQGEEIRSFSAEENAKFTNLSAEEKRLKGQIDNGLREQDLQGFERNLPTEQENSEQNTQYDEFRTFIKNGSGGHGVMQSYRALSAGGNGGALAPQLFINELLSEVEKETPILKLVNTIPLKKYSSLGIPYEKTDMSDAEWTDEIPESAIRADSSLSYAKREIAPYDLAKLAKISEKLLNAGAIDPDLLLREKLAKKFAETFEKAILIGSGIKQPLGLFTASENGISTARDVVGSNTATEITADSLIQAKMKVASTYRTKSHWILSNSVLTKVYLLKDKNDQYIWRQGLRDGEPDMLLGNSVIESDFAPSTIASNAYVAVFGDLKKYWFAQLGQLEIKILDQLFAATNEIGYKGYTAADGAPVIESAFARLKMGA